MVASLFLVAVASFGYLLKIGTTTIHSALSLNRAAYLLQTKMEEMRSLPFNHLSSQDGSFFAQGAGRVSVTAVLADLLSIQLVLEWDPDKTPLKIYSLRSKYE